jgi:hypothetical protein
MNNLGETLFNSRLVAIGVGIAGAFLTGVILWH